MVVAGGLTAVTPATARGGAALASVAGLPFALGGALFTARGGVVDGPGALPCPFRAVTGLPCPLCGATRAFVLAAHGDPGFLRYNAPLVLAAAVLVVLGALGAVRALRGRGAAAATGATAPLAVPAIAAVALVAWAWALAHAQTITAA